MFCFHWSRLTLAQLAFLVSLCRIKPVLTRISLNKSNFVNHKAGLSKNSELASIEKVEKLLAEAKDKSNQGKLNDSLEILNYCASLAPNFEEVFLAIAEVYRQKGQHQEALLNLNRAINLDPDNPVAYSLRGEIFRLLKQYEAALNDFNQ